MYEQEGYYEFPPLPGLDGASRSLGKLLMESLAPAGHTVTPTHLSKLLYVMLIKTSEGDVGQAQKDEALMRRSTQALGIS